MDLEEIVRGLSLCQDLSESQVRTLADHARLRQVAAGGIIFKEGEAAERLYMIAEGKVALEIVPGDRPPLVIQTLGHGEMLGFSWLAERKYWQWDARAASATTLVYCEVEGLLAIWSADPEIELKMMRRIAAALAGRLQAARLQLLDLYGDH
jgi:CRP-like cAMP-binding protein